MKRLALFKAVFITLVLGLTVSSPANATQSDYPNRTLRLVIPYTAGGGGDALGRLIAHRLGQKLGQNVVVENRPGANGLLGAREVVNAAPDGYTLLLVTDGMYSIAPHFVPPGATDPMVSLAPLAHLANTPLLVAARPGLPATNMAELLELAKQEPGKLTFGALNTTSTHYFSAMVLQHMTGTELTHVPFAGTAAAIPLLVSGQLDLLVGQTAALQSVADTNRGVKYLAVSTRDRFPALPDVPSISETVPGYDETAALGLMVHTDTPAGIVSRLNAAVNEVLQDEQVQKTILEQIGGVVTGGTAEEFGQLIARQREARARTIASGGFGSEPR